MPRPKSSLAHEYSDTEILDAVDLYGGVNKAAAALKVPRTSFKRRLKAIRGEEFKEMKLLDPVPMEPPASGVRRWIFTSAQCNTAIDEKFLDNLELYAKTMNATIHISGFTYNINPFGKNKKKEPLEYHPRVRQYLTNEPYEIKDKFVFCGEMDTLPTAVNPLSGFQTYTRHMWGILPHPRFVLESVPVRMTDDPKIIMTTGAVTKPNYLPRKAGIKAAFHHVIGAVVVEMDEEGDFFVRQLVADDDGGFYDLGNYFNGDVTDGHAVRSVVWGDIHLDNIDLEVQEGCWGPGGMLEELRPEYQFFHDLMDFRRRNHHAIKDPHHWYKMHVEGRTSIEGEVADCVDFLFEAMRCWTTLVVVDSNHDRAIEKWLKNADVRFDPVNVDFYLRAQAAYYKAIRERRDDEFLLFEWACMEDRAFTNPNITFLKDTDTYVVDGIEYGMHGHKGANGGRGHVKTFARMGPKASVAHTHHAAVYEGIYQAGHSCKRDVGYNQGGLTSWNHSHIVAYKNGKRTIITMRGDKWRA